MSDVQLEDKQFGFQNIGTHHRLEGTYLDVEQRIEAEKRRAKIEDREPDLDNPPAIAGTPLVPVALLPDNTVRHPGTEPLTDEHFVTLPVAVEPEPEVTDTEQADQEQREAELNREHRNEQENHQESLPVDLTDHTDHNE